MSNLRIQVDDNDDDGYVNAARANEQQEVS